MPGGNKIATSGQIKYAASPITAGVTNGLLSVFTDVSNATPAAGDRMNPFVNTPIAASEPTYKVTSGAYSGTYYINRNDPTGDYYYFNWKATGNFDINYLHSYIHWVQDQRIDITINNNSPGDYDFKIRIPPGHDVINLNTYTPNYSTGGLADIGTLPGSSGAYTVGSINTGYTQSFTVAFSISNPPGIKFFDVHIYDYHTTDLIFSGNYPTGDPSSPFPYSQNFDVFVNYWRCFSITIDIN